MKKILVALAFAAYASTSFALVENSAHDFNFSTTYSTNKASRCQYCHVPHNAATWASTALWATSPASGTLTFYSAGVTTIDVKRSQTCLACHADDTVVPTDVDGNDLLAQAVAKTVGYDLRNDHPIGDQIFVIPGYDGIKDPLILGRTTFTVAAQRTLQCATCHSVHGNSGYTIENRALLYGPGNNGASQWPDTTDFCTICHTR
jgi:hypothetical protein